MKKHLSLIIILLIVIVLGVGAIVYINLNHGDEPPIIINPSGDIVSPDTGAAAKVVIKETAIRNKTDNRYVDCVYPVITSFKDKEFENYINSEIAQNIQGYINEMGFMVDEETPATALYSYITSYDKYTSGKYLSLVISQDYQTGGIRSERWKDIYTINAESERLIKLNELFEAGSNYEEAIISEITKQAEAKNYELMGGNGLSKLKSNQKFYIQDDKLVIYYSPSEAAATVFGELHFEMPFIMNEDGLFEI